MLQLSTSCTTTISMRRSSPTCRSNYTVEQAQQEVKAAIGAARRRLRGSARSRVQRPLDRLLPDDGKRSGAYMHRRRVRRAPVSAAQLQRPVQRHVALAHELGHAMHSWFSNKTQPFATPATRSSSPRSRRRSTRPCSSITMLKQITDPKARLALLGNYLEDVKGTVFRQTQFAEFELRMHEMAEKGEPLTGDALPSCISTSRASYYGHDAKVCVVDDYIAHEWAYITHFFSPFYVFQYATSFTASTALAEKVLTGDPTATARYRAFLAAGGSKYPIDLLKDAGVDMTTSEPLDLTIKKMNRVMDEIEKLLK